MPNKDKKHVGPKNKVVSLYANKELLAKMKARADSLGMPLSRYIQFLAKKDLESGGDFTVVPSSRS